MKKVFSKNWYKYLIYISFIFLVLALYRANYLIVPRIYHPLFLVISIVLLFGGFLCDALIWKKVLLKMNYNISLKESIISVGLFIFGKYIPGKIWQAVGRAAYFKNKLPFESLSVSAVITQLIYLWVGLPIGIIGLYFVSGLRLLNWFVSAIWIVLSIIIFFNFTRSFVNFLIQKVLKRKIIIPKISIKSIFLLLPWFIFFWLVYSFGFYFLVRSLSEQSISVKMAFGYPLAQVLGFIVFFIPGGFGIREGILVQYLSLGGVGIQKAITISIAARLWFMIGEVFIFSLGMILKMKKPTTQ